ncbi:hypothetical protein DL98DRAFT_648038 [Cadophora sp. DSE1049]|nr:hypothetical protein DL98DRAFT_648038 [Cadophora sp. DSE1049]
MAQDNQTNSTPKVNGNTPQEIDDGQRLTSETQAQVPNGPSNTTTYLSSTETAEQVAMGQPTERDEERMARELAEWEAYWRGMGGQ